MFSAVGTALAMAMRYAAPPSSRARLPRLLSSSPSDTTSMGCCRREISIIASKISRWAGRKKSSVPSVVASSSNMTGLTSTPPSAERKVGTGEGIGHLPRVAQGSDMVLEARSAGARPCGLVDRSRWGGGDAATCLHEAAARELPRSGG